MSLLVLILGAMAVAAIVSCDAIGAADERQRERELAESRRRKLEREQQALAAAMKRDGTHLYKRSSYKSAVAYVAPAKPIVKAKNVVQMRGKR